MAEAVAAQRNRLGRTAGGERDQGEQGGQGELPGLVDGIGGSWSSIGREPVHGELPLSHYPRRSQEILGSTESTEARSPEVPEVWLPQSMVVSLR